MEPTASSRGGNGIASGQAPTFEQIHQAYRGRIHRYLSRLVGPRDAEDVTQLVFLRVSEALSRFRGEASVATWLYRIARNAAADWRRQAARAAALNEELAVQGGRAQTSEAMQPVGPDAQLAHREMQHCLERVIADLPVAYQEVLTLGELEGLPHAAIASALGLSVANVKVRLHRARGRLRDLVAARCEVSRGAEGLACLPKHPPRSCSA